MPKKRLFFKGTACASPGCTRPYRARGLCHAHYARLRRGKDVSAPITVGQPRLSGGYVYIGSKTEHVLVMERLLDRKLFPGESVHHKNGIRHDNRPENLELWTKAQPAGQRIADLIAWLIRDYPAEVRAAIRAVE